MVCRLHVSISIVCSQLTPVFILENCFDLVVILSPFQSFAVFDDNINNCTWWGKDNVNNCTMITSTVIQRLFLSFNYIYQSITC